ncbi:MAG: zinc-dependent alcohol dehydrogenase family protein [Gammaproteobacteria bacterium]|nr:zinc-dependent alcohol dehydrogenase family protein [Gammaproteobacteria bacterium]MBU1655505.1 zinc-dependent alcohol dehydrogenase family protein [Gammaproteobacteria bacterium]MBU1961253.1 zinc-dependent alcohol dehydrogenase family protein [Gammaproteobacteria bacterium]
MKAVIMAEVGGPERLQLREVADPAIESPTRIRVRIRAAGVNPIDTKLRARGLFYPDALPAVLGCDGAGEVVETGPAADRFRPGDRVWFCHGGLGSDQGNYAEYRVIDQQFARAMPASIDFEAAAAGPLALITAWESLFDRARLRQGQSVLIHAGAGGVGHLAIQLAKIRGARVLTSVSNMEKARFVQGLGADEVILYTECDFADRVNELTGGRGADVIFDTVGPAVFRQSIPCTAPYGDLVTLLDPGEGVVFQEARNRNLRISLSLMLSPQLRNLPEALAHQGEILDQCARWIDEGRLRIAVGKRLPLAQAAEAHRLIEEGHTTGKIVLVP